MKFAKTIVAVIMGLALLVGTVKAADAPKAPEALKAESLFNAKEFGLTLSTGYDLGAAGTINGKSLFNHPYTFNLSAGVSYFPWRVFGIEANVPFYQTKGVSVDEVQAGLLFRFPLSKSTVILRNIAPYIGVGAVYAWDSEQEWAYVGKLGSEFRLNKKWGFYAEGQYRNFEVQNWGQGGVSVAGGLRLVF